MWTYLCYFNLYETVISVITSQYDANGGNRKCQVIKKLRHRGHGEEQVRRNSRHRPENKPQLVGHTRAWLVFPILFLSERTAQAE